MSSGFNNENIGILVLKLEPFFLMIPSIVLLITQESDPSEPEAAMVTIQPTGNASLGTLFPIKKSQKS